MTTRFRRWTVGLVAVVLIIGFTGACGRQEPNDPSPVTPTTERYTTRTDNDSVLPGYPPRHDTWEVAVQIDDPRIRAAAEFAAETETLMSNAVLNQQDADEYQRRTTRRVSRHVYPDELRGPPSTGGYTYRVVDAVALTDSRVEVNLCLYFTPGEYVLNGDGQLVNKDPYLEGVRFMSTFTFIDWTTEADATGRTTEQPRWLATGGRAGTAGRSAAATCEPHMPQPFVFGPPPRTDPTATPR